MNRLMDFTAWAIIGAWLPFSIPLIVIGALARLGSASIKFGWDVTDTTLAYIARHYYERSKNTDF